MIWDILILFQLRKVVVLGYVEDFASLDAGHEQNKPTPIDSCVKKITNFFVGFMSFSGVERNIEI
jgi:hypothetical protein